MDNIAFDKSVFFDMSYGMYVLGVMDGQRPTGCVVNTVFQITSEPSVVAVSVNHSNYTNECIKKAHVFSVNILGESVSQQTIGTFGFRSGRDTNKFESVVYHMNEVGLPVLSENVCGHLTCKVINSVELSTHTVFFAEIIGGTRNQGGEKPMTYAYYHLVRNGKSPKAAPTYIEESPQKKEEKWVCKICGYVYDDSQGPFELLPDTWTCPLCGAPKSMFEKK